MRMYKGILAVAMVGALSGCGSQPAEQAPTRPTDPAQNRRTPAPATATTATATRPPVVLPDLHTTQIKELTGKFVAMTAGLELDANGRIPAETRTKIQDHLASVSQAFKGRVEDKGSDWWMDFSEARQQLVFSLEKVDAATDTDTKTTSMLLLKEAAALMDALVDQYPD